MRPGIIVDVTAADRERLEAEQYFEVSDQGVHGILRRPNPNNS